MKLRSLFQTPDQRLADENATLKKRILDLEADREALNRTVAVRDAEIKELAALVARNHERVKAETADWARRRAECETGQER